MSAAVEPMEVEDIPQLPLNNDPDEGTLSQSPFAHLNTGVYSGHPGLQAFLTLGVPLNAPLSAIKSAYRKLAREYHPDRVNGSPEEQEKINEKFAAISQAYNLLTNAYSQYDGKGAGEHYPVFFGTPGSLEAHKPKERDPYDLYRQTKSDLPHTAPEYCIIPGDSSCLLSAWPEQEQVPLALPYEAHPPPLPQVDAMDVGEVPHMKRVMEQDGFDVPRTKRQRVFGPTAMNGNAPSVSTNDVLNGNPFAKRDADQAGGMDFGNPVAKKRRTA